ncbi:PREDICTED: membrane cofactor protein-like [Chinchilla lanigera]|uniref:membrane cofactor protein-like n=1 Tax=Chinchilla lanigera TaxID=34839 RepID=UPI00069680C1|nr:PREDICTED: membrane cofactor protein-like [Chinchilla lanigera]
MPRVGRACPAPCSQFVLVLLLMARPQHGDSLLPSQGFLWLLLLGLGILPSVSSNSCGRPPTYSNMEVDRPLKYVYFPMEHIHYHCKPGYRSRPVLPTLAVCGPNGKWSNVSTDACYKKSCDLQVDPVNGQVILLNKSYEFGTQIQFVCNDGFYLVGNEILHCLLNGSNVHWNGKAPVCEKISCQPPPKIPNGGYSSKKDPFQYLESVKYWCNHSPGPDDFSLVGDSQLYCLGKDVWSSDPPECTVVRCPRPVVPNGRQRSGFVLKHSYRARVTFECLQGFFLYGNNTVVCAADSTWQPPLPQCLDTPPSPQKSAAVSGGPGRPRPRAGPPQTSVGTAGRGSPSSEPENKCMTVLIVVYFVVVVIFCTFLYKFIRSRNKQHRGLS